MFIKKYLHAFELLKHNFSALFEQNIGYLSKKDLLVGLMLSSFLINILGLVLPFTIIQIYDRVIPNRSYNTFAAFMIIVFIVLIIELLLKIMRGFISSTLDIKIGYSMNIYAYKTAVTADLIDFEKVPFGLQLDRFNFINSLREYYSGQYLIAICDVPFILVYFIFFYCIHVYVGMGITIICLLLLCVSYLQSIKLKQDQVQKTKETQVVSKFLIELLSGISTIKTLGLEEQMLRRYERLQKTHVKQEFDLIQEKMSTTKNIIISSQIVIITAVMICCYTIFKNYMTLGGMSACILLAGKVMQPFASLINLIIKWKHFAIARQEFNKFINVKSESSAVGKKLNIMEGELALANINFQYTESNGNQVSIFENAKLFISARKVIAIHGDRLSGKSTLINILACLFKPSGTMLIDGENIDNLDLDYLRQQIAFISEKTTLFQGTILENLTRFSDIELKKVQEICAGIGLHNIIQNMPNGYQTMVGVDDSLSRGVKQYIIIARELIKQPKIMLFDEINMDLDLELDFILRHMVNFYKGKITIVIISSRPSLLLMADEHYLIKDKKIIGLEQYGSK